MSSFLKEIFLKKAHDFAKVNPQEVQNDNETSMKNPNFGSTSDHQEVTSEKVNSVSFDSTVNKSEIRKQIIIKASVFVMFLIVLLISIFIHSLKICNLDPDCKYASNAINSTRSSF